MFRKLVIAFLLFCVLICAAPSEEKELDVREEKDNEAAVREVVENIVHVGNAGSYLVSEVKNINGKTTLDEIKQKISILVDKPYGVALIIAILVIPLFLFCCCCCGCGCLCRII